MATQTASLLRINKEISKLTAEGSEANIVNVDIDETNIMRMTVTMLGPDETPYAKKNYKLTVNLPYDYPFSPPEVKFTTPIKHVNINDNGDICIDILKKDSWKPVLNIMNVIHSISSLLSEPNFDDPFNPALFNAYKENPDVYFNLVSE
jgi:ubiquitin-conjugating enzyme E2 D